MTFHEFDDRYKCLSRLDRNLEKIKKQGALKT